MSCWATKGRFDSERMSIEADVAKVDLLVRGISSGADCALSRYRSASFPYICSNSVSPAALAVWCRLERKSC